MKSNELIITYTAGIYCAGWPFYEGKTFLECRVVNNYFVHVCLPAN